MVGSGCGILKFEKKVMKVSAPPLRGNVSSDFLVLNTCIII